MRTQAGSARKQSQKKAIKYARSSMSNTLTGVLEW